MSNYVVIKTEDGLTVHKCDTESQKEAAQKDLTETGKWFAAGVTASSEGEAAWIACLYYCSELVDIFDRVTAEASMYIDEDLADTAVESIEKFRSETGEHVTLT
jgi:Pyruvate/2-oxoacid:ferredoxin oxidoreductase delta subunit